MWPYWLMFILPALAAVNERRKRVAADQAKGLGAWSPGWLFAAIGLALLVGWRLEVGSDWFSYVEALDSVWGVSFLEVLTHSDPGYQLLNWISVQMDWGVIGTNVIGSIIFAAGVVLFCRSLPRPWLALAVATPYLVIVVGMGYSRQGIALALSMIGLLALQRKSTVRFLVWVLLGAAFHKTAVLLLPVAALVHTERRIYRVMWVGVATVTAYYVLLADAADTLYAGYVEAEYQSEGALVRLLMNAVPAAALLVWWRRFKGLPSITSLWRWFAWLSLALLVLLFVTPSSTAVDRVALYMLPLQLVVFSSFPDALVRKNQGTQPWVFVVLLYYAAVQFVWLNFANHAHAWLPYRFYPFEAAL